LIYHRLSKGKKKAPERGLFSCPVMPLGGRHDADPSSRFVQALVMHYTIDLGKNGKVPAHTYISSRVDARPDLAHEDISRAHCFSSKNFDPASLSLTISSVAGASACFLMSHGWTSYP
jgi:hypothetical protein